MTNYEIKYYEKGKGLHEPKKMLIETTSKQEAYNNFKNAHPNTMVLGVKSVKVKDDYNLSNSEKRIVGKC